MIASASSLIQASRIHVPAGRRSARLTTHSNEPARPSDAATTQPPEPPGRNNADQLGHAWPSMTQDVYMKRNVIHKEVANVMDRAVRISAE